MAHVPIPGLTAQASPDAAAATGSRCPGSAVPRLYRLGQGRWRARVPRTRGGGGLEVYTCDDPPACLVVRIRGLVWDVRVEGDLSGAAALNLGDCLVGAVTAGMGRVVLRLGRRAAVPLEAEGVLESFGRQMALESLACRLRLRGDGPGIERLVRALERGRAASRRIRSLVRSSPPCPPTAS